VIKASQTNTELLIMLKALHFRNAMLFKNPKSDKKTDHSKNLYIC